MSTQQDTIIPWSDVAADPSRLVREIKAGKVIMVVEKEGTLNYTVAPPLRGKFTVIANRTGAVEVIEGDDRSKVTIVGTAGTVVDAIALARSLTEDAGARLRVLRLDVGPFIDAASMEQLHRLVGGLPPTGLVPVEDIRQLLTQGLDDAEAEDMVSLRPKRTGVANTIFVSSGNPQHAPRIKIAVDPSDSFSPRGKNVSMQMQDDYKVEGDKLPPSRVLKQAKRWIKKNYTVLMRHWDNEISGDEVVKLLKPLPGKKRPKKRSPSKRRSRRT
jgi:hypothetical protein